MSPFTVSSVRGDGNLRVKYGWKVGNKKGAFIKPAGCTGAEPGSASYHRNKKRLYELILGKQVQVGEVVKLDRGSLVCRVYYEGRDLAEYFPEN